MGLPCRGGTVFQRQEGTFLVPEFREFSPKFLLKSVDNDYFLALTENAKNSPKKTPFNFFAQKFSKNFRKLMVCTPDVFFNALQGKHISKLKNDVF